MKEGYKLDIKYNYLINGKTVLLYGVFHENGELFTFVIEGADCFLVAMSPVNLIDKSLISYGSDFKGALSSSRKLLGENKKMYPIKIDGSLDIWLFPTRSYKKHNCVWFALNHVKNTKSLGIKDTKVFLSYGHEINIKMRESSFRNKRNLTSDLRGMIDHNRQQSLGFITEPERGFRIVEEKGEYECKSNRKKDK